MTLQNQGAITAYLQGKGLTAAQIAGVEGNLQTESNGNPGAVNPGENAHGLAQWEGGRWSGPAGLQAFAATAGTAPTDLTTQLNFMWQELQTSEHGALTALLAATTPAQAATAFDTQYERSAASSLPTRVANAQALAAGGITGGSGVVTGGATSSGGATASPAAFDWNPLNWPKDAAKQMGTWVLDGLLVVAGLVFVIVAVTLMARAGDSGGGGGASSPTVAVGGGGRGARRGGGGEALAEDAAVAG